ncbi:hypothetical protein FACS1894198_5450 [Clostridia bacterium]|nr:hypothetical protein FACS1894198_5450 [Clostridia bacterium]
MQPRTAQQIADAVAAATRENQNPAAAAAMLAGGVGVFLPANPDELVLSDLAARECLFGLDIIIAVLYGEGGLA